MNLSVKTFTIILFLAFSSVLTAQSYRIRAGFNLSEIIFADADPEFQEMSVLNPGFHIGGSAILDLKKNFYLDLGLQFTTKGFRMEESESIFGQEISFQSSINLYYLELPIKLGYAYEINDITIFGAVGPYAGIGLFGINKNEQTIFGETEKEQEPVKWDNSGEEGIKRFDAGAAIELGLEYQKWSLGLIYTKGLFDIGDKATNNVYSISLGYRFGS